MTTNLMRAFNYAVRKALSVNRPIAINLSYGNTYGAHNGTSLVERFLDNVSEMGKSVICVGSGNEGSSGGHAYGVFENNYETKIILFSVGFYERGVSIQLWKNYADDYTVILQSPGRQRLEIEPAKTGTVRRRLEQVEVLAYVGTPSPYILLRQKSNTTFKFIIIR